MTLPHLTPPHLPALTGPDAAAADAVAVLLHGAAPLGVAFSGGVDSSLLLALAVRALGTDRVLAVLGVSPSLAADERAAAHDVAAHLGARVVEVTTYEGESAAYRANGPDRCFHCKDELFTRISGELVGAHGLVAVAYGENADDARRPDRPGSRAATEHRVLRPLADAGL
ncbi:asparagine synthase-related protein, partial [Streptomyces sp. NPDC000151]|uniref:asparagine synthase-related protein n=1 Tax=Streptomyces sp. NPDC000151 TaxID=3154244 RepID=UPI00332CD5B5